MNVIKLVGPDYLRMRRAHEIIEECTKHGYWPLMYIARDNKTTLLVTDNTSTGQPQWPTYESVERAIPKGSIISINLAVVHKEQALATLRHVLSKFASIRSLSSGERLHLLETARYLSSILAYEDCMPNHKIFLEHEFMKTRVIGTWKIMPFWPTYENSRQVCEFLNANGIHYTSVPNTTELLLNDIFPFLRMLVRLTTPATVMSPLYHSKTKAPQACPLTRHAISNPVMAPDGYIYEEEAIKQWIGSGNCLSPVTGQPLLDLPLVPLATDPSSNIIPPPPPPTRRNAGWLSSSLGAANENNAVKFSLRRSFDYGC